MNITHKNTAQGLYFIQNYIIIACPHTMDTFIIFNTCTCIIPLSKNAGLNGLYHDIPTPIIKNTLYVKDMDKSEMIKVTEKKI